MFFHPRGKLIDQHEKDVTADAHLFLQTKVTLKSKVMLHDLVGLLVNNVAIRDEIGALPKEISELWLNCRRLPAPITHEYEGELHVCFLEVNRSASFTPSKNLITVNSPMLYGFSQYFKTYQNKEVNGNLMLDLSFTSIRQLFDVEVVLNNKVRMFMPQNFNPVVVQLEGFTLYEILIAIKSALLNNNYSRTLRETPKMKKHEPKKDEKRDLMADFMHPEADNYHMDSKLDAIDKVLVDLAKHFDFDKHGLRQKVDKNLISQEKTKKPRKVSPKVVKDSDEKIQIDLKIYLDGVTVIDTSIDKFLILGLIKNMPNDVDICLLLGFLFDRKVLLKSEAIGLSAIEYRQKYLIGFVGDDDIDLTIKKTKNTKSSKDFWNEMKKTPNPVSVDLLKEFMI